MADEPVVNLADVSAEIAKLSNDQVREDLLKIRVRQRVQQKKHYNPEKMKEYQQKQREKARLMKERALATPSTVTDPDTGKVYPNLWEQITAEAEKQAETEVAAEAAAS